MYVDAKNEPDHKFFWVRRDVLRSPSATATAQAGSAKVHCPRPCPDGF